MREVVVIRGDQGEGVIARYEFVILIRETERAYLIDFVGGEEWVPKSIIKPADKKELKRMGLEDEEVLGVIPEWWIRRNKHLFP